MARRNRKNTTVSTHTNLKMDNATFALRRQVIGHVRECKALLDGSLPRIEVRITESHREGILGTARMGDCVVWIPAKTVTGRFSEFLRQVVFHEVLHAAFAVSHSEDCPLMAPHITKKPLTKEQCDNLFLKHARK